MVAELLLRHRPHPSLVLSAVLMTVTVALRGPVLLSALSTNRGAVAANKGDWTAALGHLTNSIHLNDANPRPFYWLGLASVHRGSDTDAETWFLLGVRLAPDDRLFHLQLADLYLRSGQMDAALSHRRKATESLDARASARFARDLCGTNVMACVSEFDEILAALGPSDADRYVVYREALDGLATIRSRGDAERYAREALELFPDDAYFHLQLANALLFDEPEEALDQAYSVQELGYEPSATHELFGKIYRVMGRWDDSRLSFERSLQANPNNAWVHYWLGEAYWQLGRRADAVLQWEAALSLSPNMEDAKDALERPGAG